MPNIGALDQTIDEAVQWAQENASSTSTGASGATSGSYRAGDRAQAELEKNTSNRGANIQVYDPELAALLKGSL